MLIHAHIQNSATKWYNRCGRDKQLLTEKYFGLTYQSYVNMQEAGRERSSILANDFIQINKDVKAG
jgi:hypothetical protein